MMQMKRDDLSNFRQQNIRITLKNEFRYSGVIEVLSDETVLFRDKFGNRCVFELSEIAAVEQVGL